jgi:hypothetical protein
MPAINEAGLHTHSIRPAGGLILTALSKMPRTHLSAVITIHLSGPFRLETKRFPSKCPACTATGDWKTVIDKGPYPRTPFRDSFRLPGHLGVAVASMDTWVFVVPYLQSEDISPTSRRRHDYTVVLSSGTSMANGSFQRREALETQRRDARDPTRYNINGISSGRFTKRQTKNAEETLVHGRHWRQRLHLC